MPGVHRHPDARRRCLRSIAERVARTLPLRRLGRPAGMAGAISWLPSEDAGYVTGQSLFVDGGMGRSMATVSERALPTATLRLGVPHPGFCWMKLSVELVV
ncbi:SDR family oxidoreductase, partial [Nocardioides alcanivorans]|uniref:SDR family oxidoreductase n=1 Tax=Nocardioides alcanivorans TaxID=2897352 RepID=UPI00289C1332